MWRLNRLFQLKLLTPDQIYQFETKNLPDLYARLRPNLVSIVDAFDFHDNELSKYIDDDIKTFLFIVFHL